MTKLYKIYKAGFYPDKKPMQSDFDSQNLRIYYIYFQVKITELRIYLGTINYL